jgi:hypothetical protein
MGKTILSLDLVQVIVTYVSTKTTWQFQWISI